MKRAGIGGKVPRKVSRCERCGEYAPLCDDCVSRVVMQHRAWAQSVGRQWGRFTPPARAVPGWDVAADRAAGLRMIKPLRLDDERSKEALARLAIEAAAVALRERQAHRAAKPVEVPRRSTVDPTVPASASDAIAGDGPWLVTLHGRPYTRAHTMGATEFHVHRRLRHGRWAMVATAEGAALAIPLDATREAFTRAVAAPGLYRLVPVDATGERAGLSPAIVTLE